MVRYATVVAVSLCAVFAGAEAAEAQYFGRNKVHYDRMDFRLLETPHFDIYYYAEEEAAARHAGRLAERWYGRFSQILGHTFTRRQPIVLYASHPHFSQTNLTPGTPGEGTGGFIEATKSRIALPFAAGLGETDHVLGHEIAHAFQVDIVRSARRSAFALPGWFIEGMAEYLSLGAGNPHTEMWIRDAALHDRLPTLRQLDDPRFFPYRYGHAFWSYLATRFGDRVLGRALRSQARTALARIEDATGMTAHQLTSDWHASIAAARPAKQWPQGVTIGTDRQARIHVAPALSPDGARVMFISERDRLSLDLFLADTSSGQVLRKIVGTAAQPHFDSLQYLHSAGSWDASGRLFAMTALKGGKPLLVIIDTTGEDPRREMAFDHLGEIYNPSWSPDGARIVFSALDGGLSDLFIYDLVGGRLDRLTADAYADLHPAWSPDGRTIAVATDRFTTDLETLQFGPLRVGLIDLDSGVVRPLTPVQPLRGATHRDGSHEITGEDVAESTPSWPSHAKQVSPQWAPDGKALYFVSDPDGISNVYRIDRASGQSTQVTSVAGGISGITASSPSLAVASASGALAFSVYQDGRYEIHVVDEALALATARAARSDPPGNVTLSAEGGADSLNAASRVEGASPSMSSNGEPADLETPGHRARIPDEDATLASLLADPLHALPASGDFPSRPYDDRLRLESFAQPYVAAATGGTFGGALRASFGVSFGDMLKDRQVHTAFRLGTTMDDLAAQVAYINRKARWNWGLTAGYVPSRFYGARRSIERDGELVTRELSHMRYLHQWAGVTARYNIDRSRRIELGTGVRRTGFAWQTIRRVLDPVERKEVSRQLAETPAGRPAHLVEAQVAFVHDTAVFGPTSPILGQRLRLEVEPAFGSLTFADVRLDARRYFMPVRPVTIAARVEHVGRYGRSAADSRLTPLVLGLQTLVRGYDLTTFAARECGRTATECSLMEELSGSRLALLNVEVRAPLFGVRSGDFDYGRIPIEAIAFMDAGFLWTRGRDSPSDAHRFRAIGAGARANLGGVIFELTAARPLDRAEKAWTLSFLLRPGW
jgi:Tol biopolymer transport system component